MRKYVYYRGPPVLTTVYTPGSCGDSPVPRCERIWVQFQDRSNCRVPCPRGTRHTCGAQKSEKIFTFIKAVININTVRHTENRR